MPLKKSRNKKDLQIQEEDDRLTDSLERGYRREIRAEKNRFVEDAAALYLAGGILETLTEEYAQRFGNTIKARSNKTIDTFIQQTYKQRGLVPRPNFSTMVKTQYFEKFGLLQSKLITDTSFKDIQKVIFAGIKTDKTTKEIAKDILKVKQINKFRALTIARTETGFASHVAQRAAAEQIQAETTTDLYKKWLTARDGRVRQSPPGQFDHSVMDGVIVRQDEYFDVQGDRIYAPRDPQGQSGNVINCRCVVALYTREELGI